MPSPGAPNWAIARASGSLDSGKSALEVGGAWVRETGHLYTRSVCLYIPKYAHINVPWVHQCCAQAFGHGAIAIVTASCPCSGNGAHSRKQRATISTLPKVYTATCGDLQHRSCGFCLCNGGFVHAS